MTYSDAGAFKTLLKKAGIFEANKDKFNFDVAKNKVALGQTHRNIRINQKNINSVSVLHNLGNIRKTDRAILNSHDLLCVSEMMENDIEKEANDFVIKSVSTHDLPAGSMLNNNSELEQLHNYEMSRQTTSSKGLSLMPSSTGLQSL